MFGEIRPKKLVLPPTLNRSSSVKHGLAKLLTFYFGEPWNSKSLNLPYYNLLDKEIYGSQVLKLGKRKRAHPQSIFPTPLRNCRLEGVQILNQIRAHLNNERNWKEIIRNQPHPIILSFWSIPDGRFQTYMIHIWVTRQIRPRWPGKTHLRIYVRFYRRSISLSKIFSNN